MNKKLAFTLAEVLIALAILGVVVLLVFVSVNTKTNKKRLYSAQYEKVYNDVYTASKTIIALDRKNSEKFNASDTSDSLRDAFQNRLDVANVWDSGEGWVSIEGGVFEDFSDKGASTDDLSGITLNNGVSLGFVPASAVTGSESLAQVLGYAAADDDGDGGNGDVPGGGGGGGAAAGGGGGAYPDLMGAILVDLNGTAAPNQKGEDQFALPLEGGGVAEGDPIETPDEPTPGVGSSVNPNAANDCTDKSTSAQNCMYSNYECTCNCVDGYIDHDRDGNCETDCTDPANNDKIMEILSGESNYIIAWDNQQCWECHPDIELDCAAKGTGYHFDGDNCECVDCSSPCEKPGMIRNASCECVCERTACNDGASFNSEKCECTGCAGEGAYYDYAADACKTCPEGQVVNDTGSGCVCNVTDKSCSGRGTFDETTCSCNCGDSNLFVPDESGLACICATNSDCTLYGRGEYQADTCACICKPPFESNNVQGAFAGCVCNAGAKTCTDNNILNESNCTCEPCPEGTYANHDTNTCMRKKENPCDEDSTIAGCEEGGNLSTVYGCGENDFIVYNADTLDRVRLYPNGNYCLVKNIDLNEKVIFVDDEGNTSEMEEYYQAGEGWKPIGTPQNPFSGRFKGNGFTINNLTIKSDKESLGLFGHVSGSAQIYDININGTINSSDGGGASKVGALAGYISGSPTISSINSQVEINCTDCTDVGGIAGKVTGGTIRNVTATGNISAADGVGGLVGTITSANISYSYATGNVTANGIIKTQDGKKVANAGGLVGYVLDSSTINSVYASGMVIADGEEVVSNAGGLFANLSGAVDISNTYAAGTVDNASNEENATSGGLLGHSSATGSLKYSYSYGEVKGSEKAKVGGFMGINSGLSIISSYFDKILSKLTDDNGNCTGEDCNSAVAVDTITLQTSLENSIYKEWSVNDWCFNCNRLPALKNMPAGAPSTDLCHTDCRPCDVNAAREHKLNDDDTIGTGKCICNPGYYGDGLTCTICPEGHYCPGGTEDTKTKCPTGFEATQKEGAASILECYSCMHFDITKSEWDATQQKCVSCFELYGHEKPYYPAESLKYICNQSDKLDEANERCEVNALAADSEQGGYVKPLRYERAACQLCPSDSPAYNPDDNSCSPCPTDKKWIVESKDKAYCEWIACPSDSTGNPPDCVCNGDPEYVHYRYDTNVCEVCADAYQDKPYWDNDKGECTACPEITPIYNQDLKKCVISCPDGSDLSADATYCIVNNNMQDTTCSAGSLVVQTPADLARIGTDNVFTLSASYCLTEFVDLAGYAENGGWAAIGSIDKPFTGIFDGNGNTIANLKISKSTQDYQGLFGVLEQSSVVKNLYLQGNVLGHDYVGILAGAGGKIENCTVVGDATGRTAIGGMVGLLRSGSITKSSSQASVSAQHGAENAVAGGLVGVLSKDASILNSYVTNPQAVNNVQQTATVSSVVANANAYAVAGGLVGSSAGNISSCYTIGNVISKSQKRAYAGGLVGFMEDGSISNSYGTATVTSYQDVDNAEIEVCDQGTYKKDLTVDDLQMQLALGGFVGRIAGGEISDTFSTGIVNANNTYAGGFAGIVDSEAEITNSYLDKQTSRIDDKSQSACAQVAGTCDVELKSTDEMYTTPDASIYTDWSFEAWCFGCDKYPVLKAMKGMGELTNCRKDCRACVENADDPADDGVCVCKDGFVGDPFVGEANPCAPCPIGSFCANGIEISCASVEGVKGPATANVGAQTVSECILCSTLNNAQTPYWDSIEGACKVCPAGSYCDATSGEATLCPAGSYCPEGSTSDTKCDAGYYCVEGSSSPEICPSGSYCASAGLSSPTECGAGKYCPEGSTTEEDCEAGKYCETPADEPVECQAGTYCAAGSTEETECQMGSYCPAGSEEEEPCEAGYYCQTPATDPVECEAGTYCAEGSYQPTTCPKGAYCGSGAITYTQCPLNATSPAGSTSASACTCIPGYFGNGATSCAICPEGSFCMGGTHKQACPENGNSPAGSASELSCTCVDGYFYENCPDGTVKNADGGCDCPTDTPYWNGSACVACGVGTEYDSTSKICADIDDGTGDGENANCPANAIPIYKDGTTTVAYCLSKDMIFHADWDDANARCTSEGKRLPTRTELSYIANSMYENVNIDYEGEVYSLKVSNSNLWDLIILDSNQSGYVTMWSDEACVDGKYTRIFKTNETFYAWSRTDHDEDHLQAFCLQQ